MPARKKVAKKAPVAKKAKGKAKASAAKATPLKKGKAKIAKATPARKTRTAAKAKVAKTTRAKAKKVVASKPKARKAKTSTLMKPISQKQTKSQIYAELSDMTELSKADVKNVVSAMRIIIERHVKPRGSGEVTLPDLGIKVRRIQKKATKARMGRNPFTGEDIKIPAKPARKSVKVSAMKTLKTLLAD